MTQAETARIHERLDELLAGVGAIQLAVKERDVFCLEHSKKVARHEKVLFDNGTDGLITEVKVLKHSVDGVIDEQRKGIKWMRSLVGVMVLAVLGYVTQAMDLISLKASEPATIEAPEHDHHVEDNQ